MNLQDQLYNPPESVIRKVVVNHEESQLLLSKPDLSGMNIVLKKYDAMENFFSNLFPVEVNETRQRSRHIGSIDNLEAKIHDYYSDLVQKTVMITRRRPLMSEMMLYSALRSYGDMKTMEYRTGYDKSNWPPVFGTFTPIRNHHVSS